MPTIIDVAQRANVSKSTVSRVVSGNGYVSSTSRQKVLTAMAELDYVPNVVARNLQRGKTKTIGFIVHHFIDPLTIFLESFLAMAQKYEYTVTLFFTGGNQQKEIEALNQLKFKQLDGLFILTRSNDWSIIEPYHHYGPIATWHRVESTALFSAYIDHYPGYLHTLDYLYAKGYRKIGHILGNKRNLNTKARIQALTDFEMTHALPHHPEWLLYDRDESNSGKRIAHIWHEFTEKPQALAFYTDIVAAECLSELQNLGYVIPRDVALIGFDNSKVSQLMQLTTIDYSLRKQAENAFLYLYNQLNHQQLPYQELSFELIERETVASLH